MSKRKTSSVPAAVSGAVSRVQAVAIAFVEDTLPSAERALESAKYACKVSGEPKFKGDLEHWQGIVKALKWMRSKSGAFARRFIQRYGDVDGKPMGEPRE